MRRAATDTTGDDPNDDAAHNHNADNDTDHDSTARTRASTVRSGDNIEQAPDLHWWRHRRIPLTG